MYKVFFVFTAIITVMILVLILALTIPSDSVREGAPIFVVAFLALIFVLWKFATKNRRTIEEFAENRDVKLLARFFIGSRDKSENK